MAPLTNILLEVACFNVESIIIAARAGADRIEFCKERDTGGLTPSSVDLRGILQSVKIPINIMIRSRPGTDFTANPYELHTMIRSIQGMKSIASGFVFGVLDSDGYIDQQTNWDLVRMAYPRQCTFHRAFDHAKGDLYEKLETVRRCGFSTILTSGWTGNAAEGTVSLKRLVDLARPMQITIMVGGGVRSNNLQDIMDATGAEVFHTAAITESDDSCPDPKEIAKIREIINDIPD